MEFCSINAIIIAAHIILTAVSGSPVFSSTNPSSGLLYQSPNISLVRPPSPAACSESMGYVTKKHCMRAINRLPHDPPMRPVIRNFYASPTEMNPYMLNERLPVEKTYGDCTAQIILAAQWDDVPNDQTSWINLIGPARILMRDCADRLGTGGVLVRNGDHGNIEVILYNQNSMFGRVQTMRHSTDPVAVSIAQQELLEMLHLVPNIYDAEEVVRGNLSSGAAA